MFNALPPLIMVLMLATGLSHIDTAYEKAATSLGAGPINTFLTITLPLSLPGIVASVTTAFAWTFSAFATPQLIGGGKVSTVATLVYQLGFSSLNFPFAAALSVAGLIMTLLLLAALKCMSRSLQRVGEH
jgi:putative spermidine/putrescine transport system permease protein